MKFYMIRRKHDGKLYRRTKGRGGQCWHDKEPSCWTSMRGVAAVLSWMRESPRKFGVAGKVVEVLHYEASDQPIGIQEHGL